MSPKRFFYILCGALAAIVLVGGAGYYYASTSLQAGAKEYSQRLADEQLIDQRLADLEDLQKQHDRLTPLLPIVYAALPTQKDQTKVALQLRNIANSSGMRLDSLEFPSSTTPGPTSQTIAVGDVLAIPITFQLQGSYAQLQTFLQKQERLDRYTDITSLTIDGNPSQGGSLHFDVTLNAYVKP